MTNSTVVLILTAASTLATIDAAITNRRALSRLRRHARPRTAPG